MEIIECSTPSAVGTGATRQATQSLETLRKATHLLARHPPCSCELAPGSSERLGAGCAAGSRRTRTQIGKVEVCVAAAMFSPLIQTSVDFDSSGQSPQRQGQRTHEAEGTLAVTRRIGKRYRGRVIGYNIWTAISSCSKCQNTATNLQDHAVRTRLLLTSTCICHQVKSADFASRLLMNLSTSFYLYGVQGLECTRLGDMTLL